MKCQDIFLAALKLIGEVGGAEENADYAERASYILASFISEASEADAKYRLAHGLSPITLTESVYIALTADFPLHARFAAAAAHYLSSLLICDENPELSDTLYDKYCDGVMRILKSLPAIKESIKNEYV